MSKTPVQKIVKGERKVSYNLNIVIPTLEVNQVKEYNEAQTRQMQRELADASNELQALLGKHEQAAPMPPATKEKRTYTPRAEKQAMINKIVEFGKTHETFKMKEVMPEINRSEAITNTILHDMVKDKQIKVVKHEGAKLVYALCSKEQEQPEQPKEISTS